MSNTPIKNTSDLRKMLLDSIEQVRAGGMEPKQAREIARLSTVILESAKLDLDVLRYNSTGDKLQQAGERVLQLVSS